jgi:hypothetical protein
VSSGFERSPHRSNRTSTAVDLRHTDLAVATTGRRSDPSLPPPWTQATTHDDMCVKPRRRPARVQLTVVDERSTMIEHLRTPRLAVSAGSITGIRAVTARARRPLTSSLWALIWSAATLPLGAAVERRSFSVAAHNAEPVSRWVGEHHPSRTVGATPVGYFNRSKRTNTLDLLISPPIS